MGGRSAFLLIAVALGLGLQAASGQTPGSGGSVLQRGGVQPPPTNRSDVRPGQPQLVCPDPAVTYVAQPDPHEIRLVPYTAVVQNVGLQDYRGASGRQSVVISLHVTRPLSPSYDETLATQGFTHLAPGERLSVPFSVSRDITIPPATHTLTVSIVIDPRNATDADPLNNDCNTGNNALSVRY